MNSLIFIYLFYQEWDKHKGHFNPENKQYFSESKQRFRALLYKFTKDGQLKKMPSKTKFKKVFCIGKSVFIIILILL